MRLREIGIQMLRDNKEKILKLIDEVHVIHRMLVNLWDEKELCYSTWGKLEIDIDSKLLERQGQEWVDVDTSSDPSAGWIILTLFVELMRHNPMRLTVSWMKSAIPRKIFEIELMHDEDYLHLESKDHIPEIKEKISRRIDIFISKGGS